MKPPNITPPPDDQLQTPSHQQPPPTATNEGSGSTITAAVVTATTTITDITATTTSAQSPIISTKSPQSIAAPPTTQVQQAPLALTAQPQIRPQLQAAALIQHQQQQNPSTTVQSQPQLMVSQTKIQPTQLQAISTTTIAPTTAATTISASVQPVTLTTAPNSTGPTALVIIPQHSTTTTVTQAARPATIPSKLTPITTTVGLTTAHVTLAGTTQSTPIQLQATTTSVPNITTPVPIAAHQQSTTALVQPALASRPPSTLPIVPITAAPTNQIKPEPNKYICCLLDNGVRCDRVAGNASFSARIQKIVGTKKMNYALDPTVRHAYICEHHKAIITVAKKSTTLARDTKSNARNYTANNNANTLVSQPNSNFNDLSMRPQQSLQHPVNMELVTNQNTLVNNHTGTINNVAVRPGAQIAYGHYQGPHPNQVGSMDVMMSTSFDTGGDSVPSCSGGVDVDLQQLQVNTLRRYKRHFRVPTRPGLNKMQLAESLKSHFRTLPIIEKEAITYFVYIVKCYRNKLDHNPKAD